MRRVDRCGWIIVAFSAFPSIPVQAQSLDAEVCPAFATVPGASDPDERPIHRCNLDNAPTLVSSLEGLPTPMYERSVGATLSLIIDPDGRVNEDLTGYLSISVDPLFHRKLLEALRELEYEVGKENGEAVRYGHGLSISTGTRADTISERLSWRYVSGVFEDSLIGTWEVTAPEPRLSIDQTATIARSVTHTLREMQVLLPGRQSYCILFDGIGGETVREAVRASLYDDMSHMGPRPGPPGCESDVTHLRYRIGGPQRAGGGRTVVQASGDVLSSWPPGFDGRWWRAWTAECVVPDVAGSSYGTQCTVNPVRSWDPLVDARSRPLLEAPEHEDGPVEFAVEVTTSGAFRTDTIRSSIPNVPALEDRTVFRSHANQCEGLTTWTALADWPGEGELVLSLTLPLDSTQPGSILVTEVRRPDDDYVFHGFECPSSRSFEQPLALFTLGGVGRPLEGPVRFCLNEPRCRQSFVIEPGAHQLAAEPHIRFRLDEIRESARRGKHVSLRVAIDRDSPGLIAFVIVRMPDATEGSLLHARGEKEFRLSMNRSPPHPPETEFWIYLATAGRR
jgi:hypothetical protein